MIITVSFRNTLQAIVYVDTWDTPKYKSDSSGGLSKL